MRPFGLRNASSAMTARAADALRMLIGAVSAAPVLPASREANEQPLEADERQLDRPPGRARRRQAQEDRQEREEGQVHAQAARDAALRGKPHHAGRQDERGGQIGEQPGSDEHRILILPPADYTPGRGWGDQGDYASPGGPQAKGRRLAAPPSHPRVLQDTRETWLG